MAAITAHEPPQVALVTDGYEGLGFALVKCLCKSLPKGSMVFMGAPDAETGSPAVAALNGMGLSPTLIVVDVTNHGSLFACARILQSRHGGLNIVVHNTAVEVDDEVPQKGQAGALFNVNNLGTARVYKTFAPVMRDEGRFLVVSSGLQPLTALPADKRVLFDTRRPEVTLDSLDTTVLQLVHSIEAGTAETQGWPSDISLASKVAQVCAVRLFARQLLAGTGTAQAVGTSTSSQTMEVVDTEEEEEPESKVAGQRQQQQQSVGRFMVHAVCPGEVSHSLSASIARVLDSATADTGRSPDDAAADVVWLCTGAPFTQGFGELVRKRAVVPWM